MKMDDVRLMRKITVLKTTDLMDVSFVNADMDAVVDDLNVRLSRAERTFLVTANPEIMMYAQKDQQYRHILQKADLVIPDGIGIIIASKILGDPIQQRLAGFDLMIQLFHLCAEKHYSVYFLGAEPSVIEEAVNQVKRQFPQTPVAGYHHGYFDMDDPSIVREIQSVKPDVVLVGLGFPRQEQWIARYRDSFNKGLFIGVGGSFDILAGKTKRAPLIWQKLNLEWLHRLILHPSRWKRMSVLPVFIAKVTKSRFK